MAKDDQFLPTYWGRTWNYFHNQIYSFKGLKFQFIWFVFQSLPNRLRIVREFKRLKPIFLWHKILRLFNRLSIFEIGRAAFKVKNVFHWFGQTRRSKTWDLLCQDSKRWLYVKGLLTSRNFYIPVPIWSKFNWEWYNIKSFLAPGWLDWTLDSVE